MDGHAFSEAMWMFSPRSRAINVHDSDIVFPARWTEAHFNAALVMRDFETRPSEWFWDEVMSISKAICECEADLKALSTRQKRAADKFTKDIESLLATSECKQRKELGVKAEYTWLKRKEDGSDADDLGAVLQGDKKSKNDKTELELPDLGGAIFLLEDWATSSLMHKRDEERKRQLRAFKRSNARLHEKLVLLHRQWIQIQDLAEPLWN
ncbi:hypothetical protein K505DRAFT_335803 [Melanomma pulvis-pyrius CBS 109.77]|uniref:Uncharacterized protein n=1 Tax=Melanomma pulvis-pyrius CBS 109.77 TaxID=1314802 RepID=A0A6A6XI16_9PLEO|nr:hypothetical protein K505DRAFT_335803 [Melanomma pulvis-pyrius CBS 109.77]